MFIAFVNLSRDEAFHSNVIVILMKTAVDRWLLYHLYDVSVISVQAFGIPAGSADVIVYVQEPITRSVQLP